MQFSFVASLQVTIFFPNDSRCGFRKLKEQRVGNRRFGAGPVPKSLLLLLLLLLFLL